MSKLDILAKNVQLKITLAAIKAKMKYCSNGSFELTNFAIRDRKVEITLEQLSISWSVVDSDTEIASGDFTSSGDGELTIRLTNLSVKKGDEKKVSVGELTLSSSAELKEFILEILPLVDLKAELDGE